MTRIVIDTNLYVSALINGNSRRRLNLILENPGFEIVIDAILVQELMTVISRPKFTRFVSASQIKAFVQLLHERCRYMDAKSVVRHSRDPKDDFLLALCRDSASDYLITGNKLDLLDLKQFERTEILSLTQFLDKHSL